MGKLLAFVHIEKTAGISISQILRNSFGLRHCDIELICSGAPRNLDAEIRLAKFVHPRLASIASHWISPYDYELDDIDYYTFLRDPVSRTLSHYQYQIQQMGKSIAFEDWITEERYRNFQVKKLAGEPDVEKALKIIRGRFLFVGVTEYFSDSLNRLNRLIGGRLEIDDVFGNKAPDNSISADIRANHRLMMLARDANMLDDELYRHVVTEYEQSPIREFAPRQRKSTVNLICNRMYRNLVYKPIVKVTRYIRSKR